MEIWIWTLASAVSVAAVSVLAGLLVVAGKQHLPKFLPPLVAMAAGIFLGNAFLHLLPEAVDLLHDSKLALGWGLCGLITFFLLDYFRSAKTAAVTTHQHGAIESRNIALINLLGDSFHNFVDGIVIAGSYLIDPWVGLAVTGAILLHEFPHECADMAVLLRGGMRVKTAILANLFSGLTIVLGAISGLFWQSQMGSSIGFLLAFAGGAFLYIAASDLLPLLRHERGDRPDWVPLTAIAAGLLLMLLLVGQHGATHALHMQQHLPRFDYLNQPLN